MKLKLNIIYSICTFILLIFIYLNQKKHLLEFFTNTSDLKEKPNIWMFWETLPQKQKPGYIDLCYESIKHNCGNCFKINYLNEKNIHSYLPELNQYDLSHLKIQHKADFYRYLLLNKYGGLWIDADILVLKCLCPLMKQLNTHDYIGFGCGYNKKMCSKLGNGHGSPLNWMMGSKPNSEYLKCIISEIEPIIKHKSNFKYHDIGRETLRKCAQKLNKEKKWDYYHVPSTCNEYDEHGNKLNKIFKKFKDSKCSKDRYFFPFYNTAPGYPQWFKDLSAENIKKIDLPIQPIIKEAFKMKKKCK